jgi:hypothetical protein
MSRSSALARVADEHLAAWTANPSGDHGGLARFGLDSLKAPMSPRVLRAQIETDLAAANDYAARHGSFAEMAREHYATTDDETV